MLYGLLWTCKHSKQCLSIKLFIFEKFSLIRISRCLCTSRWWKKNEMCLQIRMNVRTEWVQWVYMALNCKNVDEIFRNEMQYSITTKGKMALVALVKQKKMRSSTVICSAWNQKCFEWNSILLLRHTWTKRGDALHLDCTEIDWKNRCKLWWIIYLLHWTATKEILPFRPPVENFAVRICVTVCEAPCTNGHLNEKLISCENIDIYYCKFIWKQEKIKFNLANQDNFAAYVRRYLSVTHRNWFWVKIENPFEIQCKIIFFSNGIMLSN